MGTRKVGQRARILSRGKASDKQLEPFTGGYYDNIEFEIDESAAGNYGPAYERLTEIKGQHDPMNMFRLNSNVRPPG